MREERIPGGPGGSRTHDLRVKSPLLCQLSYQPNGKVAASPLEQAMGSCFGNPHPRAGVPLS
jgi:hypothetical protein